MLNIFKPFGAMKGYLLFWLTFFSLVGTFYLAYHKGIPIDFIVPTLIGIYASHSFGKTAATTIAASKDPNASTEKVVEMTNDR